MSRVATGAMGVGPGQPVPCPFSSAHHRPGAESSGTRVPGREDRPISIRAAAGLLLAVLLVSLPVLGQVKVEPLEPVWGQPLRIEVGLDFKPLELHPADTLFATLWSYHQGLPRSTFRRLRWNGKTFGATFTLPSGAEYASLSLATAEEAIRWRLWLLPRTPQGVAPPGARVMALKYQGQGKEEWRRIVQEELEVPGLWWLYPEIWSLRRHMLENITAEEILRQVKALEQEQERTASLLRALASGYWQAEQPEQAMASLRELVGRFPGSPQSLQAIHEADYQAFSQGRPDLKEEVVRLAVDLINRAPENPRLPRERSAIYWIYSQPGIDAGAARRLQTAWSASDPSDPNAYLVLAAVLARSQETAREAERLLDRSFELALRPRPYSLPERFYLGYAFRLRSHLRARRGELSGALGDIRMAQHYTLRYSPEDLEREARLWRRAGRPIQAERVALDAWRRGSKEAEDFIRDLYRERRGSEEGFQDYLARRLAGPEETTSDSGKKAPLPPFQATTLAGAPAGPESLKGRLAVLNFWFTSCGPCLGEMPRLNHLVARYRSRVRFLAFASDPAARVREFLKAHRFDYEIAADAASVQRAFGVREFPTHIIVDPAGRILWRGTGASPENLERLETLLARLAGGGRK